VYSRSSVIGDSARAPAWPIQSSTPCPTPATSRPGNSRLTVASSIAVSATLRSGTGSSPIPTVTRLVAASIAVAVAMPLSEKQSSHTHSPASPAASAAAATATIRSGGCVGGKMAASLTKEASLMSTVRTGAARASGS